MNTEEPERDNNRCGGYEPQRNAIKPSALHDQRHENRDDYSDDVFASEDQGRATRSYNSGYER